MKRYTLKNNRNFQVNDQLARKSNKKLFSCMMIYFPASITLYLEDSIYIIFDR